MTNWIRILPYPQNALILSARQSSWFKRIKRQSTSPSLNVSKFEYYHDSFWEKESLYDRNSLISLNYDTNLFNLNSSPLILESQVLTYKKAKGTSKFRTLPCSELFFLPELSFFPERSKYKEISPILFSDTAITTWCEQCWLSSNNFLPIYKKILQNENNPKEGCTFTFKMKPLHDNVFIYKFTRLQTLLLYHVES